MDKIISSAVTTPHIGLLTEKQAAPVLGVSVPTLQGWRFRGVGPKYRKLGRAVRYAMEDLQAFADDCVVETAGS